MTYRLIWKRTALRALAAIWNSSPDPNAVTRGANFIERFLMIDPLHEGQPFGRRYRILFVTPLTVEYSVDQRDCKVTILRVWFGDKTS